MGVSKYGIKVSTSDQYVSDSQQTVFLVRVEKRFHVFLTGDLCDQNVTSGFVDVTVERKKQRVFFSRIPELSSSLKFQPCTPNPRV